MDELCQEIRKVSMIAIVCVLLASLIGIIQMNFLHIFKKIDKIVEDISHVKQNCKFCQSQP